MNIFKWRTKDLSEGAFITHFLGKPKLIRVDSVTFFEWEDSVKAKQLSEDYWKGAEIPALQYSTAHRRLKGWIIDEGGVAERSHNR